MEGSPRAQRLLRLAGWLTWSLSGLPLLLKPWEQPGYFLVRRHILWLVAFLLFGLAYGLTSWSHGPIRTRWRIWAPLAVQTGLALLMIQLVCTGHEGALLAIVALQLGWLLPLAAALIWFALQSVLMGWIVASHSPAWAFTFLMVTYLSIEALALFSAYFGASEARARLSLERLNAELQATRELLAETSRMAERQRISHELHDTLGHYLTALSLNLEVASHLAAGKALQSIQKAQSLAELMLGEVREVVSTLRGEKPIDLARALRTLVQLVPRPVIHLSLPDDFEIQDPLRAHTLLRCIQEIITNTVKHSGARNLWIDLIKTADGVEVHARDDGQGAEEAQPGQGLSGMRKRFEQLGGRFETESQLYQGFRVNAWIPLTGVSS